LPYLRTGSISFCCKRRLDLQSSKSGTISMIESAGADHSADGLRRKLMDNPRRRGSDGDPVEKVSASTATLYQFASLPWFSPTP